MVPGSGLSFAVANLGKVALLVALMTNCILKSESAGMSSPQQ